MSYYRTSLLNKFLERVSNNKNREDQIDITFTGEDGQVVGYLELKHVLRPVPHLKILNFSVEKNLRGLRLENEKGYGSTLIEKINQAILKHGLFVVLLSNLETENPKNPERWSFYKNNGWEYFNDFDESYMFLTGSKKYISPIDFQIISDKYNGVFS